MTPRRRHKKNAAANESARHYHNRLRRRFPGNVPAQRGLLAMWWRSYRAGRVSVRRPRSWR